MERKKTGQSIFNILLLIIAVAVSVFATYKTLFYGCDIDESYAITLSYRLVMGDHLFKEMWEVHQTSAIFMAPFIWAYRILFKNTIGMVVFLRLIGCVLQLFLAFPLYFTLRKFMDKRMACAFAFVFYNFTPKYLSVFEFCYLQFIFLIIILICFLNYYQNSKKGYLIVAGVALAGTVLAYPQTFLFVPVEYFLFWLMFRRTEGNKKAFRSILWIFGAEAVCGLAFLVYVLMNITPMELLENIPMILADQSHSIGAKERILSLLTEFWYLSRFLLLWVLIYELGNWIMRRVKGKSARIPGELLILVILTVWGIPVMLLDGQMGIRHLDISYTIFGMSMGLLYLNHRHKKTGECIKRLRFLELFVLCEFAGCCMGSNLSIYANSGLLFPLLLLLWMEYVQENEKEEAQEADGKKRNLQFGLILLLCSVFLIMRCTLIRFTSIQPKYIFEEMHQIGVGTAKGVYVTEKEHIHYHSKMDTIQKYVTVEDTAFYMGSDTYQYFLIGNKIGVPTSISTPIFDETVVTYFERYPYKKPTVIIVDKYYSSLEQMAGEGEFGRWLRENYDLENIVDDPFIQVVYPKEK